MGCFVMTKLDGTSSSGSTPIKKKKRRRGPVTFGSAASAGSNSVSKSSGGSSSRSSGYSRNYVPPAQVKKARQPQATRRDVETKSPFYYLRNRPKANKIPRLNPKEADDDEVENFLATLFERRKDRNGKESFGYDKGLLNGPVNADSDSPMLSDTNKPEPEPFDSIEPSKNPFFKKRSDLGKFIKGSDDEGMATLLGSPLFKDPTVKANIDLQQERIDLFGRHAGGPSKIDPKDPRIMPKGHEISIPEKLKYSKRGTLKPWWDEDAIANLRTKYSGNEFMLNQQMGDILDQQMKDKWNWLQERNTRKTESLKDLLDNASSAAYDGDFDYLEKKFEKNPKLRTLMEPLTYRHDFGITPEGLRKQMEKELQGVPEFSDQFYAISDKYENPYSGLIHYYEKIRGDTGDYGSYKETNKFIRQSIDKYKEKYADQIEFKGNSSDPEMQKKAKSAGPAIPEVEETSEETQKHFDEAGARANRGDTLFHHFTDFLTPKQRKKIGLDPTPANKYLNSPDRAKGRRQARKILGVEQLPSIETMLEWKVEEGVLDLKDQDEVEEWITRFRNPNHPDTRAMYYAWGKLSNPKLDDDAAIKWINKPIEQLVNTKNERLKDAAEYEANRERPSNPVEEGIGKIYKAIGSPGLDEDAYKSSKLTSDNPDEAVSSLMWTVDKLSRPLYAVAAMAKTYTGLNKEPGVDSWADRLAVSGVLGANPLASLDDLDGEGIKNTFNSGYQQLFRGSKVAPNMDPNTVPTTFANVIQVNAARDEEDNLYDEAWYQQTAGFFADVAFDPLNLVGVGVVDDALKVPVRMSSKWALLSKSNPGAQIPKTQFLGNLRRPNMSPVAEKTFRITQGLRRVGDESGEQYLGVTGYHPVGIEQRSFKADDNTPMKLSDPERTGVASDNGLTSVGDEFDRSAELSKINTEIKQYEIQKTKYFEDIGVQSLIDETATLRNELGNIQPVSGDLRINKVLTRTANPMKDIGHAHLEVGGGKFFDWRTTVKEQAKSAGFFKYNFKPGSAGAKAQDQIAKLDELGDTSPEFKQQRDYWTSVVTEEAAKYPSAVKPSVKDWRKSGSPVVPGAPKTSFDPVGEFASAMGIKREQFLTQYSEDEVHDAILHGADMLALSDKNFAMAMQEANSRIKYGKQQLNALKDDKSPNATKKRNATYQNLAIAYTMRNEQTIAGALRFLDTLSTAKSEGKLFSDPAQAKHLEGLLKNTRDELTQQGVQESGTDGMFGYGGSTDGKLVKEEDVYREANFDARSYGDIANDPDVGQYYKSRAAQLQALESELVRQIDELRLDKDGVITGLPPLTAYKVNQILAPTSKLRTKTGDIDTDKIKDIFKLKADHTIGYEYPTGATQDEFTFIDVTRGAIEHEYRGAFQSKKTGLVEQKKAEAHDPKYETPTPVGKLKEFKPSSVPSEGPTVRPELPTGTARPDTETVVVKRAPLKGDTRGSKPTDGPNVRALGPRPTAESLRNEFPNIFENLVKSGKKNEFGYKTKSQEELDTFITKKKKEWDKAYAEAKRLDGNQVKRPVDTTFKLSKDDTQVAAQDAFNDAVNAVLKSIKDNGEVPQVSANMRLTINEEAKLLERKANLESRYQENLLKIEELEAKGGQELAVIKAKQAALKAEKARISKQIQVARYKAVETKKIMRKRIGEEENLQLITAPPRLDGKMLQLRIAGMRINLQSTNSLFKGVEKAADLVPAKMRENFANYMVRPSKQLDTKEAIMWRAQWESKTPVIVKAHLDRLNRSMRNLSEPERKSMFTAYRNGTEYHGPKKEYYEGVEAELDEITAIWNERSDHYAFRAPGSTKIEPLKPHEILRFLPAEYSPNLAELNKLRARNKGEVSLDDLWKAIKANDYPMPQDLMDPFRFVWTMRLAADQARQLRALKFSISHTFGVQRRNVNPKTGDITHHDENTKIIEQLRTKYGWSTASELGDEFYFPPEARNDIDKLLEFTKADSGANTLFDKALGYWKVGATIYNPGYYTRNGIGEIMSSWLDGVNNPKYYRMAYRVHKFSKAEDHNLAELVKKWSVLEGKVPVDAVKNNEVLFSLKGGRKVTVEDMYREYINQGLKSTFANTDLAQGTRSLAGTALTDSIIKKGLRKANNTVHDAGEGFEDYLRMAHFAHAMEHSKHGDITSAAMYAAERVRKYHFDYTDFSTFEKSVMLRAFPFYKWTRRGAPLMLAHLFMTPGKIAALPKTMDYVSNMGFDPLALISEGPSGVLNTQDVHEDQNGFLPNYQGIAPNWVKDLFAYQMGEVDDTDEYGNYFRIQTPMFDGLNAVTGPLGYVGPGQGNLDAGTGLLNPMIKLPAEFAKNDSLDPQMDFPIVGGEYNENLGINDAEAITSHTLRSLNPITNFLTKMSKNRVVGVGHTDPSHTEYIEGAGHEDSRDIASFLTGLGFYQSNPKGGLEFDKQRLSLNPPANSAPAVGQPGDLTRFLREGRKADSKMRPQDVIPKRKGSNSMNADPKLLELLDKMKREKGFY